MNSTQFFMNLESNCPSGTPHIKSLDSGNIPYKILHLDDDPDILTVCKLILEREGDISVDSVECPLKALEIAYPDRYDLIITDHHMPKMSGLEFVEKIRHLNEHIPIIVLSTDSNMGLYNSLSNLFFITKDETPDKIFTNMKKIIHSSISKSVPNFSRLDGDICNTRDHQFDLGNLLSNLNLHDLRNCIHKQENLLDFLIEDRKGDSSLVAYLTDILQSAETIKSIIESANQEFVSATKEPQWFDMYQLFQHAVKQADENGLITCIVDNNVEVFSYSYMSKIFAILVDNTIRHGEKVTTITMSAECTEDGLSLIYEDNGIGIPTNDKEKIFLKNFGKNTGEGLFYARSLLSLLGITIHEIGKPGRGVKFELMIPANCYRQIW